MNTITIQFQGDFSNIPSVTVPVEVVDRNLETVVETMVPLGFPKPVVVSTPGLYLVRAALPSGERISTSVTIPASSAADPNPSATALLRSEDVSPHETRAWVYSIQGLSHASNRRPPVRSAFSAKAMTTVEGEAMEAARAKEMAASILGSGPELAVTPGGAYKNEGAGNGVFRLQPDPEPVWSPATPTGDPRVLLDLRVNNPQLQNAGTPQWRPYFQDLHVLGGAQPLRMLVSVPPFPQSGMVLVRSDSNNAGHPVRALVQGGDPRADALLSYLTLGAFADARTISASISDVELDEILGQKRRDPASAVVAAYFQLRAGTTVRTHWVQNLADQFPMIPDGAVQHGWCLLRQPSPDNLTARKYFLIAAQRGIPMYSYGVRLLYDGLNLLAERFSGDVEIASAFRAVRRIAAAIDWKASVTSLALTGGPSVVAFEE